MTEILHPDFDLERGWIGTEVSFRVSFCRNLDETFYYLLPNFGKRGDRNQERRVVQ